MVVARMTAVRLVVLPEAFLPSKFEQQEKAQYMIIMASNYPMSVFAYLQK